MSISKERREEIGREYRKKYFLGNDTFTSELSDYWLGILDRELEEQRDNLRIGMLRQWLNEDRITEGRNMVCNADIEFWLGLIDGKEMVTRKEQEMKVWKHAKDYLLQNPLHGIVEIRSTDTQWDGTGWEPLGKI